MTGFVLADFRSAGRPLRAGRLIKHEWRCDVMTAWSVSLRCDRQEFSLAREQREEELEKERVLKEKEDTKEREKQAKLDKLARYKCLAKRRRPRGGGGGGISGGGASGVEGDNAAGNDAEGGAGDAAWEAGRSPRCISRWNYVSFCSTVYVVRFGCATLGSPVTCVLLFTGDVLVLHFR